MTQTINLWSQIIKLVSYFYMHCFKDYFVESFKWSINGVLRMYCWHSLKKIHADLYKIIRPISNTSLFLIHWPRPGWAGKYWYFIFLNLCFLHKALVLEAKKQKQQQRRIKHWIIFHFVFEGRGVSGVGVCVSKRETSTFI